MQKTAIVFASLFAFSCEASGDVHSRGNLPTPLYPYEGFKRRTTIHRKVLGGAYADFTGEGVFDFPANETLKAGDWQYRIYEDGVKDKVVERW